MALDGKNLAAAAPVLHVRDVVKSSAYYRDALGFHYDKLWGDPPGFCISERDGVTLMLNVPTDPSKFQVNADSDSKGWTVYIFVHDVDALFSELKGRGAEIAYGLVVRELYGMKEFAVRDPDGNVLAFGQDWSGKPR